MKPIDTFSYIKHNQVQYDSSSLIQLYFPIIGNDAVAVYQYLVHFLMMAQEPTNLVIF